MVFISLIRIDRSEKVLKTSLWERLVRAILDSMQLQQKIRVVRDTLNSKLNILFKLCDSITFNLFYSDY